MLLFIVRHGQTDYNLIRRIQGQSNSHLTDLGIRQAQCLARRIAPMTFDAFYASDLDRTVDTARILRPEQTFILDKRLRERHFGQWQGFNYLDLKKQFPELISEYEAFLPTFSPPGGESWIQMRERAQSFLNDITAKHANDNAVLVVSHGGLIKALMAVICDPELKLPSLAKVPVDNTAIARFALQSHGWRLISWNDTAHLESLESNSPLQ